MAEGNAAQQESDTVENIRSAVQELLADEASGLNQADVSRESNVSTTTLSRFLKGNYPGDNTEVAAKLGRWVETYYTRQAANAQLPKAPAWIETTIARRILAAMSYAQMASDFAVVYGGAGLGKTKACERYQLIGASVWHVEMTRSHARLLAALERIANAIGLRDLPREPAKYQDRISERLINTAGLLLIDEAQHLDNEALEAIRAIHDSACIGVVLLGNESLYARITGGKRDAGFAQLFSRIGKRVRLARASDADVEAVADAWNMTDNGAREVLRDIVAKPGALRGATKCLRLASVAGGGSISAANLASAWRELGGAE